MIGYGFDPASDAGGARARQIQTRTQIPARWATSTHADWRAELRRMADALGTRAVRVLGEATPRAIAREPVETVGRGVACDWALGERAPVCARSARHPAQA